MAHGKIICSGSSQFLKTKYATGIILVIDLEVSHRENMETVEKCANAVLDAVKQHVPDAELYGPISYQFNIVLQAKHRPLFPVLFEDLEKKQAELKIESFDVTMNTLDQVFVNVTKQNTEDIKPDEEIKQFIENRKDISTGVCLIFKQFVALLLRRFHTFRRDVLQILLIILCLALIGCTIPIKYKYQKDLLKVEYVETDVVDSQSIDLDYVTHFKNMPVGIFDYGGFQDVKAKLTAKLASMGVEVRHYGFKETSEDRYKQYIKARYTLPVPAVFFFLGKTKLLSLYNPGLANADFFAQQLYYDAMFPDATIKASVAFQPITSETESTPKPKKKPLDLSWLIMLLVYPIIFALPVFIYTGERVSGAVHLYARTSMKRITYWATALITDISIILIVNILIGTILFAAKFYHVSCMGPYYLSMIAMSFGFLMQTYVVSHLFNSANVNFTLLIVYNIVLTFMVFMAATMLPVINYVAVVMPGLAMIDMLARMNYMCNEAVSFTEVFECEGGQCHLHPVLLMLGSNVTFSIILVLVLGIPRLLGLFTSRNTSGTDPNESPDVTKERARVNEGGIEAHAVVAMGLNKSFNKCFLTESKTVVTDVTFGVGKNECFGLLGPNGAGKSTTFNMMTAMLRPTAGNAYVGGVSVNKSPYKHQKDLLKTEYVETDVVSKSVDLDYTAHFKNMPVAIFDYGGFADVKAKLVAKLESMGVEVRDYGIKDNDKDRAKQYAKARYLLPVPAIIYFLGETNLISMYNPGLDNADFFAQQMYYDAMLPDATIKAAIAFEPIKTKHESTLQPENADVDFSTLILILVYPIIFALPVFIYTGERVSGAVHLYARTSMTRITYWAAAMITDISIILIVNILIGTILFAAKFYHVSCMGPYYLSMIAMSFGFLMQTYVVSHLFNSANVNFTLLIIYNLIFTFMFFAAMIFISLHFKQIVYVRAVMPSLAMIDMLERMDLMCNESVGFTKLFECQKGQCDLHPMIMMLGSTVVFGILLALVLGVPRLLGLCTSRNTSRSDNNESPDVAKERERVNEGGIEAHAVVAMGLKKEFGFCPQKESILQDLTVYETFLLFARLNGISQTYEIARSVMNCLQLATRKNILIRRCSGGEKRRISIGIALITDPNILMLDEPTAGVDPHTRRFVWEVLITLKNTGASMVLTSHSMEECEALCTRIAFLTHGRLKALGTSQHLKHVLGNQYLLNVSLTVPNEKLVEELHKQFTEKFQATGENPPTEIVLQWTFPKTNQTMSTMYKTLDEVVASANEQYPLPAEVSGSQEPTSTQSNESMKRPAAIRDCMITGATLEDIFVKLAQVEEKTKGLI
uniref:ABC transporter domain-containing protein n=1 Tax=Panagrellus redivivus TaxID=6233 RepID=A0A7E4V768_PANRE